MQMRKLSAGIWVAGPTDVSGGGGGPCPADTAAPGSRLSVPAPAEIQLRSRNHNKSRKQVSTARASRLLPGTPLVSKLQMFLTPSCSVPALR